MKPLTDSLFIALRGLRNLARQPWWIVITLMQPIVWLVLYGQLFKRVVELPGFNASSYINFLTPGVVVMTALFSGGWAGMAMISDLNRGVMDRLLVTPVSRFAIMFGRLLALAVTNVVQSLILVVLGVLLGARFDGGAPGILILLAGAILLSMPFAALSNALALLLRREESVIGASNFILLPLTFLSPVFMSKNVMPDWIRNVSRFNPVNWSVEACRSALSAQADWGYIGVRMAFLVAFAAVCAWLATRAFRAYQRSV